jgi:threonine/homoserine/homoserine lactone efflux protein
MEYIILFFVGFTAAITPGPDIFYVFRLGLCKGLKESLIAVLGILSGNILYISLVGIGLGAIGKNLYFQAVVGFFGAIYLLNIAKSIYNDKPNFKRSCNIYSNFKIYKEALLLNLSNPKAMLFFAVIVTPFLTKSTILSLIWLFLGIAFAFLFGAILSSKLEIKEHILIIINKIASVIFVLFSISLFYSSFIAIKNLIS